MDSKGITWVGHVYQKFESMCLEVEEIMYQDTVKYVEDQVQTVGASVKKFYSDVMQDVMQDLLLPSSFETVKAAAASDMPLDKYVGTLKMPNVEFKEAAIKGEDEQLRENSEKTVDLSENAAFVPSHCQLHVVDNNCESCPVSLIKSASSDLLSWKHNNKDALSRSNVENLPLNRTFSEAVCVESELSRMSSFTGSANANCEASCREIPTTFTQVSDEEDECDSIEASYNEIYSAMEPIHRSLNDDLYLTESIGEKVIKMRYSSLTSGSAEPNCNSSNAGMESLVGCSVNGDIQCNKFLENFDSASYPGQSNESTLETPRNTSSTVGRNEIKTVQALYKTRVDESCIMVNGPELHIHHYRQHKHKPYQKKICDVISSRMQSSTRKKEYEQLALWYGDDAKSDQGYEESSLSGVATDNKRSLSRDALDSEWELL